MDRLVGMRLISINAEGLIVKDASGAQHTLWIDTDEGGCCGYTEVVASLVLDEGNEPVIVKIEEEYASDNCSEVKVTFFGESKPIAELEIETGSGSGWCYGASVTISCKDLDIDKVVSEW